MCGVTIRFGRSAEGLRCWRLALEDVEGGTSKMARPQGLGEILEDDQRSAGRVHEHGPGLHRGHSNGIEQTPSLAGCGSVDRNDVAGPNELIERDEGRQVSGGDEEGVVNEEPAAERIDPGGEPTRDPAVSHEAERQLGKPRHGPQPVDPPPSSPDLRIGSG